MLPRVLKVSCEPGYRVLVTFTDGKRKMVDMKPYLGKGVFEPLRDPDYFKTVVVNKEIRTIAWPNGADMCPDVLYDIGEYVDTVEVPKREHRQHCQCPVCRNARGERKRTKKYAHIEFRFDVIDRLRNLAKDQERTITSLVNEAVDDYLEKHSA
jgi:hypothetical protein